MQGDAKERLNRGTASTPISTLTELLALRCGGDTSEQPFLVCTSTDGQSIDCTLSFREFGVLIQSFALRLQENNVEEQCAVGVLSHNSPEFWAASLAVVVRRAICVLLNHRQPAERTSRR